MQLPIKGFKLFANDCCLFTEQNEQAFIQDLLSKVLPLSLPLTEDYLTLKKYAFNKVKDSA
jgi:hypothetical protein